MVEIIYKKKGISITQIWYSDDVMNDIKKRKTDIVFYHGVFQQQQDNAVYQTFHTLFSDLAQEEEQQLAQIHKNVRYEIRRNQKEEVEYRTFSSNDLNCDANILQTFAKMYENMYAEKGMRQSLNLEQMYLYAEAGALFISGVFMEDTPVVMHSYIVAEEKVRLLHSVSEFRRDDMDANFVARCNKRLHWDDLMLFKKEGKKEYDWGGISDLKNPNGIDGFKLKFGGAPVTYYNKYVGASLLGKLVLVIVRLKMKDKG